MRSAILFAVVLMTGRHVVRAQGTILEETPAESPGADSGVSGAPSIGPKATQPVEYVPLTASERLRLYLKRTYGPLSIVQSAAGAGIAQWRGAPKEWKQGAEAYGDPFWKFLC